MNQEKFQIDNKDKEGKQPGEKSLDSSLLKAYKDVYGKDPEGLEEWEIAKRILEVLDNPNWVSEDLAKECIYKIVHEVKCPDDEKKIKIVLEAEHRAKNIFPELKNIDEVHMDQIEYAYNKWKEGKK
ncbi:hypothetical protein HZB05_02310 [Candidatus Wolfebacteria bacterium]|nr:hypothetical protein [Candidatus Wolfebacteria bacterium]